MFIYIAAILLSFIISHIIFECCTIRSLFYQIVVITCVYIVVLYTIANVKESFSNKKTNYNNTYVNITNCANNDTCIQKPDEVNMFPTTAYVPLPSIGDPEMKSMETLNPVFETIHPMPINTPTSMNVNGSIENFSLFEDYDMSDKEEPIYINAPKDKNMCANCVVGSCVGDLCSVRPYKPFQRNNPLDQ